MLALFGPLAFNIRTPRCEVSVLRSQGGVWLLFLLPFSGDSRRLPWPRVRAYKHVCSG